MELELRRLGPTDEEAFRRLHSSAEGGLWCHCVAWWVASWEGWGERTSEQNGSLRASLFARGEHDGYLLFEGSRAVGWLQVGPRDRLEKLVRDLALAPDPDTWALTCFYVAPDDRGRGVAVRLLAGVLDDLRQRGVRRVEAYPRQGDALGAGELWNGPRGLYERFGFEPVCEGTPRSVLALELNRSPALRADALPPA